MFRFVRSLQTVFQSSCAILHSRQQWMRAPVPSHPSPTAFDVVSVPNFGHSNRCVVVFHCFNLHFPDDIWRGASFHMLTCHLYISFGEVSVKVFGQFLNWAVCFLIKLFLVIYRFSLSLFPLHIFLFKKLSCVSEVSTI